MAVCFGVAVDDPVLLTVREVAVILRLNAQVVQRMARSGRLPAYRVGKAWRFERTELLTWLDCTRVQRP